MNQASMGEPIILSGRSSKFKGLEMISFQKDDFGSRLESIITQLSVKIRDNTYPSSVNLNKVDEVRELTSVISSRLKMQVTINTDLYLAAIIPFYPNRHHIFLDNFFQGINIRDQNRILDRKDVQHGTVNIEKAILGGIFSEYVNEVFMDFRTLVKDLMMSPPEVTAILLHELGHGFDACEFSDRIERNNQVVAEVFRHISDRNDKSDMAYVYKELRRVSNDITEKEVEDLIKGTRIVAGYTWFKVCIGSIQSQMLEDTYDKTSFEAASDSFAVRFGYGRALSTGLEKLHASQRWMKDPKYGQAFSYLIVIMFTIGMVVAGAALFASSHIIIATYVTVILLSAFRLSGSDVKYMEYDELKVRYGRIRNDIIEMLKRSAMDDARMKETILSIKELDILIDSIPTHSTFLGDIADFVFSSAKGAARAVKEQQLQEKLISNDLFLKSSELKVANK